QVVGLMPHYRVIAYDMLGHGASPRPAADTGLLGYAEQPGISSGTRAGTVAEHVIGNHSIVRHQPHDLAAPHF
ncbi:hypothetical protein QCD79_34100, partial [Pseudomonas quasicaspiana]|nr:hypothetical protein [Pseudomonas quasicaspiana]